MQDLIVFMPLFDQIVAIGSKESIDFLLNQEEILPAKKLLHHSLHQVNQGLKEDLIFIIGPIPFLRQALAVEADDYG